MTAVTVILIICLTAVLIAMYRSGSFVKSFFVTALQGLISFAAVNVTGLLTGVTLSMNWYTLLTVTILGLPSTVALTVLKFIMR